VRPEPQAGVRSTLPEAEAVVPAPATHGVRRDEEEAAVGRTMASSDAPSVSVRQRR